MPLPTGTAAVLLDIEGTTTPVSFVWDVLFPFAESRLEQTCERSDADPRIAEALTLLKVEHAGESGAPPFGNGAAYARMLMKEDRKSTGVKSLQGLIWEEGYRNGELRAAVFDDVPAALAAWRRNGTRIRIYSSGSVLAQKLLFAHTDHGDLTAHFEGYHDTTTGPKKKADSYRAIARDMDLSPGDILFLSDSVEELDAAREARMRTGWMRRPGNPPRREAVDHEVYDDFRPLM